METINRLPLLLTPDELEQITGRKLRKQQIKWLADKHWQFEINARGAPIIARSYAEARLSGINATPQTTRARRPNFDAIRPAA